MLSMQIEIIRSLFLRKNLYYQKSQEMGINK
jgi:hypothetical protein